MMPLGLRILDIAIVLVAAAVIVLWPGRSYESSAHIFQPVYPISDPSVHVLFVGDVMLDRNVSLHALESGVENLFAGAQGLFAGHDAVVGNLEGTITTEQSIAQRDHTILRFTFDPRFADVLKSAGFTVLGSANNHALDFGKSGYVQTVEALQRAGIMQFGAPFNDENISAQIPIRNKMLCMVGYHELFKSDPTSVLAEIVRIRPSCSYIVLMTHWGIEYQHAPSTQQVALAHEFIDAGVDVIIGAHPHVVEPLEIYNNHAIFYSLGNFLFDQGFSPQVMRGLAVDITFADAKTTFVLTAVNTYEEVSVADATTAQAVLEDVVTTDLPQDIQNDLINKGSFELIK